MINSGFIFISYSFHAGQPLPCPQPLSIHLHPWARCSGRRLPGGAGREEMLIPQPEVWPAAQTVCSIFCCVSITQQYSTVIFNYFTLFEKIKQESEKWGTERWTCSLSRSHFFYRDRSPSAASFLLAPVHAGVLPCPSGVQVSLHCDREMETPWPQYKILSHSQHLKWLYAFFFHKRFKYMGPYVAQDAWNSENYENNSSPPLRIFHLYKAENTKY